MSAATDRVDRALTELMAVRDVDDTPGLYEVTGESGENYVVDTFEGPRCTCEDHKHRGGYCKHLYRVVIVEEGDI